ncbi:MAG: matrixin family metalloprotease [Magnetococcales bacterium]|nr:matrixin family metalloprotease [Magnetococcales bacterium]
MRQALFPDLKTLLVGLLLLLSPHQELLATSYFQPYLGISSPFGRWNTTIPWVYNPTGAPALFSDSAKVVAMIQETMAEWAGVCGVKFSYQGIDNARKDVTSDQMVAVIWGNTNGAAAFAGPSRTWTTGSDRPLGYDPFTDGSVVISPDYDWSQGQQLSASQSETLFKKVIIHEIGHLIGLGHSDNPVSLMYANPYNGIAHLMPDDIAAGQAYYGPSGNPATPATYTPPATTTTLFTSSQFYLDSTGKDSPVTTLTDATPDNDLFNIKLTLEGSHNHAIILVVTDPSGYAIQETTSAFTCQNLQICYRTYSIGYTNVLKKVSGTYHVYVIADGLLADHHTFAVNTNFVWNRPPNATLTLNATSGQPPLSVKATVSATDPENNTISLSWHIPGQGTLQETGFSGSATRTLTFDTPGEYVLFAVLDDNSSRYSGNGQTTPASSAGEGARLVLRQTITVQQAITSQLDVEKSGGVDATDGVLILRQISGAPTIDTGLKLPNGQSNALVISTISALGKLLDVDQSGTVDATDGVLILRHISGAAVIDLGLKLPDGQNSDSVKATINQLINK